MADRIEGRYIIRQKLGEGGMGAVYLAEDERLGRQVAIKRLRILGASEEVLAQFLERFRREARAMARMQHPNIVTLLDYGVDTTGAYLVIEYLPNGTLKDRMGRPVSLDDAVRWIVPVTDALGYLHQRGMVHRDVKPANILFDENDRPMLADFGIVKLMEGSEGTTLTATGAAVGTPAYMAPELIGGEASAQSDQYALGVILYECLTGVKPFEGRTPFETLTMQKYEPLPDPRKLKPDLLESVCALLRKVLAKGAEERYASVQAFGEALGRAAAAAGPIPTAAEPVEAASHPSAGSGTIHSALRQNSAQAGAGATPSVSVNREGETMMAEDLPATPRQDSAQALRQGSVQAGSGIENKGNIPGSPLAEPVEARPTNDIEPGQSAGKGTTNKRRLSLSKPQCIGLIAGIGVIVLGLAFGLGSKLVSLGKEGNGPLATATNTATATATRTPTMTATTTRTSTPTVTLTPTLGVGSTKVREADGMVMVYVPEGVFTMGSERYDDTQPVHEVRLDAYWIDKYEVTNGQYVQCVAAGACATPYSNPWNIRSSYYGNAEYADYPVVYVGWGAAAAYCAWAGGSLPTEAQWEKAARGTDGRTYPWGEASPSCILANYAGCVMDTNEVGSYPEGASPYGAMDMAGNVWEWVADWYDSGYYGDSPLENPIGPTSGTFRVLRGGSWNGNVSYVRSSDRYELKPYSWLDNISFRCASSP